jgi:hypothetical protein
MDLDTKSGIVLERYYRHPYAPCESSMEPIMRHVRDKL